MAPSWELVFWRFPTLSKIGAIPICHDFFDVFQLFWSFEFVSKFGFRASDLVAAAPRCVLCDPPEVYLPMKGG